MSQQIKTDRQIDDMRSGGAMLATVLDILAARTQVGITPREMAQLARSELRSLGGQPAFLGYKGFPDVICISVNNQVQHAIPSNRPMKSGDLVNYDFGVRYRGLITDGGRSLIVAESKISDHQRLLKATELALKSGLNEVRDGARVGDISAAIEKVLLKHRLGIVRDLVGHGVGQDLHEDPEIPNWGKAGHGPVIQAGMTIAIEPIATLGSGEISIDTDGWTLWTTDGSWAAQFEHTVLVTNDGYEILTTV